MPRKGAPRCICGKSDWIPTRDPDSGSRVRLRCGGCGREITSTSRSARQRAHNLWDAMERIANTKPEISPAARRAIKALLIDDVLSRRISKAVCAEIVKLGLRLQWEHGLHEPKIVYPLFKEEFKARAIELGIIEPEK